MVTVYRRTDSWGERPFALCFEHKVIIRLQLFCFGAYLEGSQGHIIPVAIVIIHGKMGAEN
jgi:hypothetical protein